MQVKGFHTFHPGMDRHADSLHIHQPRVRTTLLGITVEMFQSRVRQTVDAQHATVWVHLLHITHNSNLFYYVHQKDCSVLSPWAD